MRSAGLDLFKAMLVVGMVTIHVVQLIGMMMPSWVDRVGEFINLVTFSGFLFAMGIGVGFASDRVRGWGERLKPALMLLVATWVSSLAFAMLVDRLPLTTALVLDVVTLRRLFGWSEFLASFFVLYLALALARPLLVRMATDNLAFGLALALAAASTWVVVDMVLPGSATLVGTTRFASFPLLPYLPWFLFGIRVGRAGGRVSLWGWGAAALALAALVWFIWSTGALPERFPPTMLWVAGPALVLLVYWALAKAGAQWAERAPAVLLPGRHVLSFLLVSNLLIFSARWMWGRPVRTVEAWLGASLALVVAIGLFWLMVETLQRRTMVAGEPAR